MKPEDFIRSIHESREFLEEMKEEGKLEYKFYHIAPIFRLSQVGNFMYVQYYRGEFASFQSVIYGFDSKEDISPAPKTLYTPFDEYIKEFSKSCTKRAEQRTPPSNRRIKIYHSDAPTVTRGIIIDKSSSSQSMQIKVESSTFFPTPDMSYSEDGTNRFTGKIIWFSNSNGNVNFGLIKNLPNPNEHGVTQN